MNNKIKYLCDTNIFVSLYHEQLCEKYLNEYQRTGVVIHVHNEIKRTPHPVWNTNDSLVDLYDRLSNLYDVLNLDDLGDMKEAYILEMEYLNFRDLDNESKPIKNLGEASSLIFAYFLGINYIHAEDNDFADYLNENKDKYVDINLIGISQIVGELVGESKRIKTIKNIELKRKKYQEQLILSNKLKNYQNKYS